MPLAAKGPRRYARVGVALVAIATLAATVGPATAAPQRAVPKPRIIKVADDFFAPAKITIVKNKLVRWVWAPDNTNSHNVVLKKGPSRVSKSDYKSPTGAIGVRFQRRFPVVGNYDFICTLHSTVMKLDITVKR